MQTRGSTARGRLRVGGSGLSEIKSSGVLHGSLKGQAKVQGSEIIVS